MLMFVGENIEALTIASRREESAWKAPAVAQVVTREQIYDHGFETLSEALSVMPGFYMAKKPWGTSPYLRGISNSTLFLYDTVPLGAESDKSVHQLDYNLSLAPVKRIEIIRGPGSVLWGPDAFAGIVNIVPLSGRDINGVETGISHTSRQDANGFYLNMGQGDALWDSFLSISGRSGNEDDTHADLVRFWGNSTQETPVPPEQRYGDEQPGESGYLEAYGQLSYRDLFKISGRLTNNHHPYSISDNVNGTWLEKRDTPSYFAKMEANRPLGPTSTLRFTGFYNELQPEYGIIDKQLQVSEETSYAELIYDRSFLTGRGLLTGGVSYRKKHLEDAPVWKSYLPDFLGPENEDLFPLLEENSYSDALWSGFGQYTLQWDDFKGWLGVRFDDHDVYQDNVSFNTGLSYSLRSDTMLKLLFGSAYRTPSSRQLITGEKPTQEKIETLEAQLAYNPTRKTNFSLVAFTSKIADHIKEDPYAQLSLPNSQNIYGTELDGKIAFTDSFSLAANLTLLDNDGPDETYHLLNSIFIRPDGSVEYMYEDIKSPYDTGPKAMFNLSATWQPIDRLALVSDVRYIAARDLINAREGTTKEADSVWLMDLAVSRKDILHSGFDVRCAVKNIFDTRYKTPGLYGLIDGDPLTITVLLQKRW